MISVLLQVRLQNRFRTSNAELQEQVPKCMCSSSQ